MLNLEVTDFEVAGIALNGGEVKTIRKGSVDLSQSYAKIIDGEVFLINANIPQTLLQIPLLPILTF